MVAKAVHQEGGWCPVSDASDGRRGVEDVESGLVRAAEVVADYRARVDVAPGLRARIPACEVAGSIERNDTADGRIVSCLGQKQGKVTGHRASHECETGRVELQLRGVGLDIVDRDEQVFAGRLERSARS